MIKKQVLANFLASSNFFRLIGILQSRSLVIFNYHRIYNPPLDTPFDKGVYEHSVEEFEIQLKLISKHFDVISEQDLIDSITSNSFPSKRTALITFDDGYVDNYTIARPLLKQYKLPAIYFIPTLPIENRKLGWWDLSSYLISQSKKSNINIGNQSFPITNAHEKASSIQAALARFKLTPYEHTKDLIEGLSNSCEVALPSIEEQSAQWMSWEQIKSLPEDNVAIGSHTHSHRVLATLDEQTQFQELKESKEILEEKVGRTVQSFSYPVGGYDHFTSKTKELVK
ncbi:hypothetical protein A3732_17020, partial [Oleiphilus sp. HI0050]